MDDVITMILAFLGSALLAYEANYLIWLIQEKRKPKRVPIDPKIFETYKHRKHDDDDDDENKDGE